MEDAQLAHSKTPSRYSAGLVEIAKGTHSENEELLNRLASVVGIGIDFPELKAGSETVARKDSVIETSAPATPKPKPREVRFLALGRRDTGSNTNSACTKAVILTGLRNSRASLLLSPFDDLQTMSWVCIESCLVVPATVIAYACHQ